MGKYELSPEGTPWFDGSDYFSWNVKMKAYLQTLEDGVWNSVKNGYTPPKAQPKGENAKRLHKFHVAAMNAILISLSDDVKIKIGHQTLAKMIWDTLENLYSKEPPTVQEEDKGDPFKDDVFDA